MSYLVSSRKDACPHQYRGHLLYLACICPLPPFLAIFIIHEVNNQDDCCGFLKSSSFDRQGWWWWWWWGVAQKERIFRNLQYIYIYTWQEDRKSFLKSFWSSCSRCCESTSPARWRVSQQCNIASQSQKMTIWSNCTLWGDLEVHTWYLSNLLALTMYFTSMAIGMEWESTCS